MTTTVHPCAHVREGPEGPYRRLCPAAQNPIPDFEDELKDIGAAMTDSDPNLDSQIPAGYTYLGQFVDHDLTWNRAPLGASREEHVAGPNRRTARLDLDHMYGGGPQVSPSLYEDDKKRFRIGDTVPSPEYGLPGGRPRDFHFIGNQPQIGDKADFRNTENIFLRQIHVLFLKFHNVAVEQLERNEVEGDLPDEGSLFDRARALVTWHYQYLIWWDFLRHVVHSDSFRAPRPLPSGATPREICLPLEFSLAGFRFGHSLVRNTYALNCHRPLALLSGLINEQENTAPRLRDDQVIEWGRFFRGAKRSGPLVFARQINTHIAAGLHALTVPTIRLFTPPAKAGTPEVFDLAARTLIRGAQAHLASGQEVAAALEEPLVPEEVFIRDDSEAGVKLREAGLSNNVPLWYYLLKEAEYRRKGEQLGPLGGRILQDTIEEILQNDRQSYLFKKGAKWQPGRWKFPDRPETVRQEVSRMSHLIRLIGDDHLLPRCKEIA